MLSGSYTGNGEDNRQITGLGFQPDVVIIKGNTTQGAVMRTSTMTGDNTKTLPGLVSLKTDQIQTLDADGFTIGTHARVNTSGVTYYWTAFKAKAGEVAVGSYTGNATDNRSITGVGFQPDYVIVLGEDDRSVFRSSSMTGDVSFRFDSAALADQIQALEPDGFQVGLANDVNRLNGTIHYVAWKAVAGKMAVGSYTGDGTDNRNISGVGFQLEYVIIKHHGAQDPVHHPASLGPSTDSTLNFTNTANIANSIQALQSGGFQVGTHASVNSSGATYHWAAFGLQCWTVADVRYVAATAQSGQVTLYWGSALPALVLRKTTAFAGEAPTNGTSYNVGDPVGAATVVDNDSVAKGSFTRSETDGSTYYYRVFGKCATTYAAGVGTEVNARPVATSTGTAWSYMLAGGSILKAGITGNGTIYTSSNGSWIASLNTANGTQSWEPVSTSAAIQGWLTWIPISPGGTTTVAIGGDQAGKVYSVNAATGGKSWTEVTTGADAVQASAAAQVRDWSDAAFQAAYTTDVLFAASRNTSTTNNKVYAIRASNGAVLWTFNGSGADNVDYIVGMPYVDYVRNRIYVASRAGASGTQSSLWVINALNGALVTSFALGHLETSPTLSYDGATLYVGNTAGDLYAINAATLALKWTSPSALGTAIKGFVWEDWTTAGRLYFSTADGNVWCLQDPGAGAPPNPASPVWKTAVAGASTPVLLSALYVGSSDGKLHQLNISTGVDEKQFIVGDGTATVGDASTEDTNQVFVGTTAGKIYKIPLPLP